MAANFELLFQNSDQIEELKGLSGRARLNMARAINKIVLKKRTEAAKQIAAEINLPPSYLAPAKGRLTVSGRATSAKLEGRIRATARPTSLARYLKGRVEFSKRGGVRLEVGPGNETFIPRGFAIRLRAGAVLTDTQFNAGVAIRLRPGETVRNKTDKTIKGGLTLLYGPSVQQAFLNNRGKGIADELAPDALAEVEVEFARLMAAGV